MDPTDVQAVGQHYTLHEKLGEGAYGVVYRGVNKESGALVAIKKLRLDGFAEGIPATAIREITFLQELNYPYIVKLLDIVCARSRLYLIFELLSMDLHTLIQKHTKRREVLPTALVKRFTKQMLLALWYCHNNRVIHRDLKPGNVLVAAAGDTVKIADFGLARAFELPLCTYTHEVVTLWYRPPEILLGETHYTPAVDVWSVGCIIAEMSTGKPLFRGESEISQLHKIFNVVGTPSEASWAGVSKLKDFNEALPQWAPRDFGALFPALDKDGAALLGRMLTACPADRATVADCLHHPWLADVKE
jgi:cyclin-dependent kinase 3